MPLLSGLIFNIFGFNRINSKWAIFFGGGGCVPLLHVGRDSSVGIATRYRLNGPGSNPGGGEIFRTRPDRPWGPPSLLYNRYRVSFLGVKRSRRGVDHQPHLAPRLKSEYSIPLVPLWTFVACSRVRFTFTFMSIAFSN